MIRAIRAVSTYRGRDPRDFTLLAFGGSGPDARGGDGPLSWHQAGRDRAACVRELFSAVGLLQSHSLSSTLSRPSSAGCPAKSISPRRSNQALTGGMEEPGPKQTLDGGGLPAGRHGRGGALSTCSYVGQAYELSVQALGGGLESLKPEDIARAGQERFHQEHERTYGHKADDEPVEIVNLRMTALGRVEPRARPVQADSWRVQQRDGTSRRECTISGPDHGLAGHAHSGQGRPVTATREAWAV